MVQIPWPLEQLMRECRIAENARGLRVLVAAVSILLLVACHNPTGPAGVEGQYQLISVNGNLLPCCTQTIQDTISAQISQGGLEVGYTPGRYEWNMTYMYHSADGATHLVQVPNFSSGRYSVRSDTATFVDDSMKLSRTTAVITTSGYLIIYTAGDKYDFSRLPL